MSAEEVYNQVAHEYPPFSLDDTDSLFKLFYICMERYAKQEAELTWAACEKYNQLSLEHPGDEHLFPSIPSKDEYLKKYNV